MFYRDPLSEGGVEKHAMRGSVLLCGDKGIVLLVVIWICAILILLGLFGVESALIHLGISSCQLGTVRLFYIAEAGIEHARGVIDKEWTDMNSALLAFSCEMAGTVDCAATWALRSGISFEGGSYRVEVNDNDDGDSAKMVDSDGTIVVRSIGADAQGRVKIIEAGVKGTPLNVIWWKEIE